MLELAVGVELVVELRVVRDELVLVVLVALELELVTLAAVVEDECEEDEPQPATTIAAVDANRHHTGLMRLGPGPWRRSSATAARTGWWIGSGMTELAQMQFELGRAAGVAGGDRLRPGLDQMLRLASAPSSAAGSGETRL